MNLENEYLIKLCRELISTPSLSGQEKEVAQLIKKRMTDLGYDEVSIDEYGSVIGRIKGEGDGPTIVFDGHMDTVDIGNISDWKFDPYKAEIENGRIYGRGTSDMKGALSAMIYAASMFTENRLPGDLYVTCTVHEEMFEGVALQHILKQIDADYVIIGEASNLNLKTGQRGRAEINVITHGKSCHSANPQHGINAVYLMQTALQEIKKIKLPTDEHLGTGIMELTDIISKPYPGASVVPAECLVTYDRRLLVGETEEKIIEDFSRLSDLLDKNEVEVKLTEGKALCYTGKEIRTKRFFPAWYFDQNESFVQNVLKGLHNVSIDAGLQIYSFCTNGSSSAGIFNIPTLGFGPSEEHQAHVSDEYIEIEQLQKAAEGYMAIAKALIS